MMPKLPGAPKKKRLVAKPGRMVIHGTRPRILLVTLRRTRPMRIHTSDTHPQIKLTRVREAEPMHINVEMPPVVTDI